jgi:hypothetical protein
MFSAPTPCLPACPKVFRSVFRALHRDRMARAGRSRFGRRNPNAVSIRATGKDSADHPRRPNRARNNLEKAFAFLAILCILEKNRRR